MNRVLTLPFLTRRRIWLAYLVAIIADALQLLLGPAGWAFFDEVIDVVALSLLTLLIGFHPLFLPTFVLEFMPVTDMLPTWTGCVALVVALRRKQKGPEPAPPDVIDV
jgi:hypothetical protein